MKQKDVDVLDVIQTDNSNSVKRCCTRMFTEWCQRTPKASWKQLITALKKLSLNQLASELEGLLMVPSQELEGTYYNVNFSLLLFVI